MRGDTNSGFFDRGIDIVFIVAKKHVSVILVMEGDFAAIHLGAEVVGVAENDLSVGAITRKLEFNRANPPKTILKITIPVV